jgi:hypothetical protein
MTEAQRKSMIEMYRRMEAAYTKFGQVEKAEQARRLREKLEAA